VTPDFSALGIQVPEVLLPAKQVDLAKWAVVACDQYTAEPEYWERVVALTGDAPSTLNLIYPEVFLGKEDGTVRIANIHRRMREYLQENILVSQGKGFVLVDRQTSHSSSRKGLMVALDLECYDYRKGSRTLIRATEGTVVERIPPRVKIRAEAPVELPHIMVLIDDPEQTVIEPLAANTDRMIQVYRTELMMNGGKVTGYQVNNQELITGILKGLQRLADREQYQQKYATSNSDVLLYAVGDGNHSLATAKAVWEQMKLRDNSLASTNHPARYALVELVNIHDPGLCFEPIHRVVFDVTNDELFQAMHDYYQKLGCEVSCKKYPSQRDSHHDLLIELSKLRRQNPDAHFIEFVTHAGCGIIKVQKPLQNLEVGTLQTFLDVYTASNQARVDYIHGDEVVTKLGLEPDNIGFYLPPIEKSSLFKTVTMDGALPRKTFSMGEAEEKRFYMECRKII
jgi:uncharacterized protein (DUF1015 family)